MRHVRLSLLCMPVSLCLTIPCGCLVPMSCFKFPSARIHEQHPSTYLSGASNLVSSVDSVRRVVCKSALMMLRRSLASDRKSATPSITLPSNSSRLERFCFNFFHSWTDAPCHNAVSSKTFMWKIPPLSSRSRAGRCQRAVTTCFLQSLARRCTDHSFIFTPQTPKVPCVGLADIFPSHVWRPCGRCTGVEGDGARQREEKEAELDIANETMDKKQDQVLVDPVTCSATSTPRPL